MPKNNKKRKGNKKRRKNKIIKVHCLKLWQQTLSSPLSHDLTTFSLAFFYLLSFKRHESICRTSEKPIS